MPTRMVNRGVTYLRKRVITLLALTQLILRRLDVLRVLHYVRKHRLTFLGIGALAHLALAVDDIERKEIPGILIEAGTALGGSSILIASAKKPGRILELYDTFEMIPQPTEEDGNDAHQRYKTIKEGSAKGFKNDPYYGYQKNLYEQVKNSFATAGFAVENNHVRLVKGLIEETLQINQPVALVHIDCDWYSPVMACLEQIVPHLSPGGIIIVDDYDQWSGARKAVDTFFRDRSADFIFKHYARLHIIKRV